MKAVNTVGLLLGTCALPAGTFAQAPTLSIGRLDVNQLNVPLTHQTLYYDGQQYGLGYPNGSPTDLPVAAGIWITGKANYPDGQAGITAAIQDYGFGSGEVDFLEGPIGASTGRAITDQELKKVFTVDRSQVNAHLADLADGRLDQPIDAILRWPGRGNSRYASTSISQDLAPFIDADGDGLYDPYRGDYPAFAADQALWWVFNSQTVPRASGGSLPSNVEVQVLAQAYEGLADVELARSLRYTYTVINRGSVSLDSVSVAMWQNFALGCPDSMKIGSIPALRTTYVYNSGNRDEPNRATCFEPEWIERRLPILATRILNASVNGLEEEFDYSAAYYMRSTNTNPIPPEQQDPTKGRPAEFRALAQGRWRLGTPQTAAGRGYLTDGPQTSWYFDGTPGADGPWTSCNQALSDPRTVLSATTTSRLEPGERLSVDFGVTVIEGLDLACPSPDSIGMVVDRVGEKLLAGTSAIRDLAPSVGQLRVSPNPSSGAGFRVEVSNQGTLAELQLFDVTGRLVRAVRAATENSMEIAGLAPGVYVLVGSSPHGTRWIGRALVQ